MSKAFKIVGAVILSCALALSVCACSKKEEVPEPAQGPTGTLELSAVCEGAPEAALGFSITNAGSGFNKVDVAVNGDAQTVELSTGTWVVRCTVAPKTTDGQWVFKAIESFSVHIEEGKATVKVISLELNDGLDGASEVVEAEVGSEPDGNAASGGSDEQPSGNANQGSGNGGNASTTPGNGGGNDGSGSGNSTPSQPSHTHNWVWQPNVVTVVDQDAWDEPVYRWATVCNLCGTEVSDSHGEEMMLQGQRGHTLGSIQIYSHTVHHDAVTHTEDLGHYECSGCGAWQ